MSGAVFPWRSANRFELLIDGPSFFPQMLVDIARAEHQVDLELYLVEAGACAEVLVQALAQAAERGVRVRCLLDDYGSLAFGAGDRHQHLREKVRAVDQQFEAVGAAPGEHRAAHVSAP